MAVKTGKQAGFTLLELMIIVSIIGILAAMAFSNYSNYVKRVNRADLQVHILKIAQNLESYRLVNHSFWGATLSQLGGASFPTSGDVYYQLTLTDISGRSYTDASANLQTWLIVARPIATGMQKGTGAVSLTSTGEKCWFKGKDIPNLVETKDMNNQPVPPDTCLSWESK